MRRPPHGHSGWTHQIGAVPPEYDRMRDHCLIGDQIAHGIWFSGQQQTEKQMEAEAS